MSKLYIPISTTLDEEQAEICRLAEIHFPRSEEVLYRTKNGAFLIRAYIRPKTEQHSGPCYVVEPNRVVDGVVEPAPRIYTSLVCDGMELFVSNVKRALSEIDALKDVEIILNKQKCIAREAAPGKMRLRLMGTFIGEEKEAFLLIPSDMTEEEIENLQSLWLCEQERRLGLPVGDSCSSAGFDVGWCNDDADHLFTNEYDEMVKVCYKNVILLLDPDAYDDLPWYHKADSNSFSVPREWLQEYLKRFRKESVEYFLRHYLFDDALCVYDEAKKEGKIVWESSEVTKPEKYFVQTFNPDNTLSGGLYTSAEILNMVGFADCSGCRYAVYDFSTFGEMTLLEQEPNTKPPYNFHRFVNSRTGETAFEGYSDEH